MLEQVVNTLLQRSTNQKREKYWHTYAVNHPYLISTHQICPGHHLSSLHVAFNGYQCTQTSYYDALSHLLQPLHNKKRKSEKVITTLQPQTENYKQTDDTFTYVQCNCFR